MFDILIVTDKPATTNKDNLKLLENLKPVTNVSKPLEATPDATSPPLSPPLLSRTDSLNSSKDSQTLHKTLAGSSAHEKHYRVRTTSGSGSEVIKKSFKDLQRSSVSIARYQSMLDEVSSGPLANVFSPTLDRQLYTYTIGDTVQCVITSKLCSRSELCFISLSAS